jgi:N-acetylglucosamine kinase-like BadF-type ATPase
MDIWLGIDGGGTGTRAILVESSGRVIGQGEASSSNYHNVGLELAIANIVTATRAAWTDAGMAFREVSGAFLGCAGVKADVDIDRMRAAAEHARLAPTGRIVVANDLHNALAGGLNGAPGIALIAGTGTNCLGRDVNGQTYMCGGWGWLIDDEGGGFGLVIAAMKAVARAADGRGETTALTEPLLEFLGITEPNEILARLYVDKWTPGELAAFAPRIMQLASNNGDAVAIAILEAGASALADLVATTASHLNFADGADVVVLGGCARSAFPYQPLVETAIRARNPFLRIVEPQFSPTHGAALNALRTGAIAPLPPLTFSS